MSFTAVTICVRGSGSWVAKSRDSTMAFRCMAGKSPKARRRGESSRASAPGQAMGLRMLLKTV
ncbi:hypothetical protein GCM10023213_25450 [Prosthecobacter algae]|uniref:Uncharacterized protein n=1 Tax=Prosthecobacter algae TaxID=1144682 RepID=A0ABP9P5Z5_9BACT